MAFSAEEGKQFFKEWLYFMSFDPKPVKTILDVGAGAGTYGKVIRTIDKPFIVHAVEPYEPYVGKFKLEEVYDQVSTENILEMIKGDIANYDLVILGDVLEHLSRPQAYVVWNALKGISRFMWLSLPVVPFKEWFWGYKQPAADWEENPLERHQHEWQYQEVLDMLGPFLWQVPYRTVGVFIAEGNWEGC